MNLYEELPKDPVMLLSFINTQLRDNYHSLADFANAFQVNAEEIIHVLRTIDYEYDPAKNQFI